MDNVNDHRAAAIDLQAEEAARPAAPCAPILHCRLVKLRDRVQSSWWNMSDSVGAADLSLDNDRVNRADEKGKLVKLESDIMGGTTIRRLASPTA